MILPSAGSSGNSSGWIPDYKKGISKTLRYNNIWNIPQDGVLYTSYNNGLNIYINGVNTGYNAYKSYIIGKDDVISCSLYDPSDPALPKSYWYASLVLYPFKK